MSSNEKSFLVGGENFVWAKSCGLIRIKDLKPGHEILSVVGSKIGWEQVEHSSSAHMEKDLVHLISDRSEIVVPEDCKIYGIGFREKARNVKLGQKIGIFESLNKVSPTFFNASMKHIMIHDFTVPLSHELAYIAGVLSKRITIDRQSLIVKLPTIQNENMVKYSKTLKDICEKILNDIGLDPQINIKIEEGSMYSWIIFLTRHLLFFNKLQKQSLHIISCGEEFLKEFMAGMLDVSFFPSTRYEGLETVTFIEEHEIRRRLYNFFSFYGVKCKTFPSAPFNPREVRIYINAEDLSQFDLKNPSLREVVELAHRKRHRRKSHIGSKIRAIYREKSKAYEIFGPGLYWSPVVELIRLHT